jgi:hypothetical protein
VNEGSELRSGWVEVPDCLFCKGRGWVPEWQDVCPSDGHRTAADRLWWAFDIDRSPELGAVA